MSNENRHPAAADDRLLDRLVDGELSADQRRQALAALGQEPDGWRRCALAFLQSQLLRDALSGNDDAADPSPYAGHSATDEQGSDGKVVPGKLWSGNAVRPPATSTGVTLAVAASLLLAFAAGYMISQFGRGTADRQASHLAAYPREMTSPPERGGTAHETFGDPHLEEMREEIPVAATFLDTTPLDEYWKKPSAVPLVVKEQLQSLGMDIQQQRGFVPVRAQDGRHFVVPYEDIRIVPVNDRTY